jgi:hypothetical protein
MWKGFHLQFLSNRRSALEGTAADAGEYNSGKLSEDFRPHTGHESSAD